MERASGARLPVLAPFEAATLPGDTVRIVFGPGEPVRQQGLREADLTPESFRIKAAGNTLAFFGRDANDSASTLWAVGHVLDRHLGVRWLWPGEVGACVPHRRTITVPEMDLTTGPPLIQRRLRSRGSDITDEWLRRQRMGSRMQYRFGHSFPDWWKEYSKAHPDYFAVPPEGCRQPYPRPEWVKLNIGNPAVADHGPQLHGPRRLARLA